MPRMWHRLFAFGALIVGCPFCINRSDFLHKGCYMQRFRVWSLLHEAAIKKKKEKTMGVGAALNTPRADINEILLGYYCLGGKWKGFQAQGEAQKALNSRKKLVGEELYMIQSAQAKTMADESLKWAKANGYKGTVKKAWWTARPGVLSKAVGYEVDSRKNPTDTLLQFADGQFLGLSAKSTQGKGDIGFKNPGIGTIDRQLNIDLHSISEREQSKFAKAYGLADSKAKRKTQIRAKKALVNASNQARDAMLRKIRNALLKKLKSMSEKELREHLLKDWMDAGKMILPPYIKVTGKGNKPPFSASIHDPLSNSKSSAVQKAKLSLKPVGNDAVGVLAGGKQIMKMRAKFESQAMASAVKFSGDPW